MKAPVPYRAEGPARQIDADRRPPLLPVDLPAALKWLSDAELGDLAGAIAGEQADRAGRTSSSVSAPSPPNAREKSSAPPDRAVTTSQLNAIRASLRAGVKPTLISRQFGVSQATIRDVIAKDRLEKRR